MRKTYLLFLVIGFGFIYQVAFSQMPITVNGDFSYHHLYSPSLDKYIRTYNIARPFLQKHQPLIQHGGNIRIGGVFAGKSKVQHGIYLSNSLFFSYANNPNYLNSYTYNLFGIGYKIRIEDLGIKNFSLEGEVGYVNSILARYVNGSRFAYEIDYDFISMDIEEDITYSRANGNGASVSLYAEYGVEVDDNFFIAPKIGFGYVPFLVSRDNERVISQTMRHILTKSHQFWGTVGVSFIYKQK